jgi:hypothetical protein
MKHSDYHILTVRATAILLHKGGLSGLVIRASAVHLSLCSILDVDSCEKSRSTLCLKSWGFLQVFQFPSTGKVDRVGWDKHS